MDNVDKKNINVAIIIDNIVFKILQLEQSQLEYVKILFLDENLKIIFLNDEEYNLCFEGAEYYNGTFRTKKPHENLEWKNNMWVPPVDFEKSDKPMIWSADNNRWEFVN
jgi:hypothetical protein